MRTNLVLLTAALTLPLLARTPRVDAPPVKIAVAVARPGAAIPSTLLGVFFEDINFAADGGIGARAVTLTGSSDAENSLESPTAVSPSNAVASVTSGHYTLPPLSVVVLRVRIS